MTRIENRKIWIIRKEYTDLIIQTEKIISSLDVKDTFGKITEPGYHVIAKMNETRRSGGDITESISIIGPDKWLILNRLWQRMRKLEDLDLRARKEISD